MYANPYPMRRLALRPVRRVCLDPYHTDPDTPCPYCDNAADTDLTLGIVTARHAELVAEDAELYGWDA